MDTIDYWRLCDELSVVQAALLIVGQDPSDWQESVELNYTQSKPPGYDAARAALIHAIEGKRLRATIVYDDEAPVRNPIDDDPVPYCPEPHPSWHESRISVEDLQDWLISRGIRTGFFFPASEPLPDYLSRLHPNHSPKLAAAIEAWTAISGDAELRRGKSVKQALSIWLRQHANEFGLTKEDGNPNEQGIEDIAKIANWDTKGGAPKTPGND
jgi:hypothetical protein